MKAFVSLIVFLAVIALLIIGGCTKNGMASNYGGTMTIDLPAGQKLVCSGFDKEDDLWYTTRPMIEGEKAVTNIMHEKSKFGVLQGTVNFVEHNQ